MPLLQQCSTPDMNDIMKDRIKSQLTPQELFVLLGSFYEFVEAKDAFKYPEGEIPVVERFKGDLQAYAEQEGLTDFVGWTGEGAPTCTNIAPAQAVLKMSPDHDFVDHDKVFVNNSDGTTDYFELYYESAVGGVVDGTIHRQTLYHTQRY